MTLYEPLDLKNILMVDVAGGPEVFSFVAILIVAFLLSKFNFSNKVNLTLFALFAVIMATYIQGIYVLVIIIAGIVTYYAISKISK